MTNFAGLCCDILTIKPIIISEDHLELLSAGEWIHVYTSAFFTAEVWRQDLLISCDVYNVFTNYFVRGHLLV